jgi:hypothetical protein
MTLDAHLKREYLETLRYYENIHIFTHRINLYLDLPLTHPLYLKWHDSLFEHDIYLNIFRNSVPTSRKTKRIIIMKTNCLKPSRETTASYCKNETQHMPIPRRGSAALPLAGIAGSNPARRHTWLSLVSAVCGRVESFAMGWSLIKRSSTDCGLSKWMWTGKPQLEEA